MSARHSSNSAQGIRISAIPQVVRSVVQLAPRQLGDEIELAKTELKGKGKKLGSAGVFIGVALVFACLLVIALVVAAILGLATIMPPWLAALIVAAAFIVIAGIGALVGVSKFKRILPLVPQNAIRGLKHDLGIAKEGSQFDAAILDPESEQAKAAKKASEEAKAKAKEEKAAAKEAAHPGEADQPHASQRELMNRLDLRRKHLTALRDDLNRQMDPKAQVRHFVANAKERVNGARASAREQFSRLVDAVPESEQEKLRARWKPIAVAIAASAAVVVLLRKLNQR
ncbi:phage holin family protein [Pseudarthrobacter sp. J1763]|uniref:phage holin family protein n=1 Tax=Pseudarthrobacter sp. J1763 TaxID=3420445 RepID=UPI003D2786C3